MVVKASGRNHAIQAPPTPLVYKGEVVKQVPVFKYLGVLLSADGSLRPHFEAQVEKVRRAMYVTLSRVARLTQRCPLVFRITLLRAYVISLATYCVDCLPVPKWYMGEIDKLVYRFLTSTIRPQIGRAHV